MELYNKDDIDKAKIEMEALEKRFKVTGDDIIYAVWKTAKSSVWAKLKRDTEEKEKGTRPYRYRRKELEGRLL